MHSAKIHARLRSHSWRKRERERVIEGERERGRATVIAAIEQLSYRMIDDSIVRPFPCPLPRFRASGIQKAGRHFENGRNYGKFGPGRSIDPRDFIPCNISLSLSLFPVNLNEPLSLSLSLSLSSWRQFWRRRIFRKKKERKGKHLDGVEKVGRTEKDVRRRGGGKSRIWKVESGSRLHSGLTSRKREFCRIDKVMK